MRRKRRNPEGTLAHLCYSRDVAIQVDSPAKLDWDKQDKWQQDANSYRLKIHYNKRSFSFDWWQGTGIKHEPSVPDVMDSLLTDAQAGEMSFEEFLGEFGYDRGDPRRAKKIWNACKALTKKMKRLLGADYETFLQADRN